MQVQASSATAVRAAAASTWKAGPAAGETLPPSAWRRQLWLCAAGGAMPGISAAALIVLLFGSPPWLTVLAGGLATAFMAGWMAERFLLRPLLEREQQLEQAVQQRPRPAAPVPSAAAAPPPAAGEPRRDPAAIRTLIADKQRLAELASRERQRAERTAAQLHVLFDAMTEPLFFTGPGGEVRALTESAATLAGVNRTSAVGSEFQKLVRLYEPEREHPTEHALADVVHRAAESRSAVPTIAAALLQQPAGTMLPVLVCAHAVRAPDGNVLGVAVRLEVTDEKAGGSSVTRWSQRDPATDLLTREAFLRRTEELVQMAQAQDGQHALILVSVDSLGRISSRFGRGAADEALWQIGQLLRAEVGSAGDGFRAGVDHFAILLSGMTAEQARPLAQRLRDRVDAAEMSWSGHRFEATISACVADINGHVRSAQALLSATDVGLLQARNQGGNLVVLADEPTTPLRRTDDRSWIDWLLPRLDDGRLHLISQAARPIHPAVKPIFEVLLRIEDDDGAWVAPGAFLAAVENQGLTTRLDDAVLARLVSILDQDSELLANNAVASVNLCGASLLDEAFVGRVLALLRDRPSLAPRICFEIDETFAAAHELAVQRFVTEVVSLHGRCALDRCRTVLLPGNLGRLPLHLIKIHDALMRRAMTDPLEAARIEWMVQASFMLGRRTVAVGIESEEMAAAAEKLGVDYVQGVHVNKMGPLMN